MNTDQFFAKATDMTLSTHLITKAELRRMVPYTPQHILRLEKANKFPRRVQVGEHRVAWVLAEVQAWIETRVNQRPT